MYLAGCEEILFPIVTAKYNEMTLYAQPIYLMQNRYPSPMLNSWDGSLKIDEKNNTILSSMVGAGKKNSDNSFSGVLMGEVEAKSGTSVDETLIATRPLFTDQTGMGLYGFHKGA
jgi:hypothetical protein